MFVAHHGQSGIFPLQDHRVGIPKISARLFIAGARVIDPKGSDDPNGGFVFDDEGRGTAGDIHPWRWWAPDDRACGAWINAMPVRVVGQEMENVDPRGRPITGADKVDATLVLPIRNDDYGVDKDFALAPHDQPDFWPRFPNGYVGIGLAGTNEGSQQNLFFPTDPRIIVPDYRGSADMGTLFVDLDPEDTIGVDRSARAQTLFRVVRPPALGRLDTVDGPTIAVQMTYTAQGNQPGFFAAWGLGTRTIAKGGRPPSPTTPSETDKPPPRAPVLTEPSGGWSRLQTDGPATGHVRGPAERPLGSGGGGGGGGGGDATNDAPKDNRFDVIDQADEVVCFLSREAFGPLHVGDINDKHRHGTTHDGEPINSGHLGVRETFFFENREKDAPLEFAPFGYPNPGPLPIPTRVHLSYDPGRTHPWMKDSRQGLWRWWGETFFVDPASPPGGPPPTSAPPPGTPEPKDPPTTGGSDPKDPGTPEPKDPGVPEPKDPDPSKVINPGGQAPGQAGGTPKPGDRRRRVRVGNPTMFARVTKDGKVEDEYWEEWKPDPKKKGGGEWKRVPKSGRARTPEEKKRDAEAIKKAREDAEKAAKAKEKKRLADLKKKNELTKDNPLTPKNKDGAKGGAGATGAAAPTIPLAVNAHVGGHGASNVHESAAYSYVQTAGAGHLWMPQHFGRVGGTDFRYSRSPEYADVLRDLVERPAVVRMEAWGREAGVDWSYTERPSGGRLRGGTAPGGVLVMPPEVDIMDKGTSMAPNGVSRSTSYLAVAPGAYFGFGVPDTSSGDLADCGFRMGRATSGASIVLQTQSKFGGSWSTAQSLEKDTSGNHHHVFSGTAMKVPSGTTAQRPATPANGDERYNSTLGRVEFYENGAWVSPLGVGSKSPVEAKTADYTLVAADTNKAFTNEGAAGAVVFSLPPAVAGMVYGPFIAQAAQVITIDAAGGDTIRYLATVSAASGNVASSGAAGEAIARLVCINATEWIIDAAPVGTWTIT